MSQAKYDSEFWKKFAEIFSAARGIPLTAIFNPPASEDAILAAESHVGFRLPEEVRAAFKCFDGQKRVMLRI